MLPTCCPPTIWAISLEFCGKPSILDSDDFLGACCRKAMTPKKLWTSLSPKSLAILKCDGKSQANAILFAMLHGNKKVSPYRGLVGNGDVYDRKSLRFAIAIFGARRSAPNCNSVLQFAAASCSLLKRVKTTCHNRAPESGRLNGDKRRRQIENFCLVFLERTPTGSYSRKACFCPSRCLLESPFLEPLLRTLLRTLPPSKNHGKTPSKNPS